MSSAIPTTTDASCTVISNSAIAGIYRHLTVAAPAPLLRAQPGQFFNLLCPPGDEDAPFLRRPMSLYYRQMESGRLHFLYKIVGRGTRALARLRAGETLDIFGPLGRGFRLQPQWRRLLIVARGVGLATLAALAQRAQEEGRTVTAVCSARSQSALAGVDFLEEMGVDVRTVVDDDGSAAVPAVETLLRRIIEDAGVDALFTCGSNRLLQLMQELGQQYALPGQVALEERMACGLGMCHGCVRPIMRNNQRIDVRVCKEGPVFDLQEAIAWQI